MINLMYLVLTALLALNVSNEILHAFRVINASILKSNESIVNKNKEVYFNFEDLEKQPGRAADVKPYKDAALRVKSEADSMVAYLDTLQQRLVDESGGIEKETQELKREDNIDASTLLFINRGMGAELKKRLTSVRASLLNSVADQKQKAMLDKQLPLRVDTSNLKSDNNPQGDWATAYFYNMPAIAGVTLFSKFKNDVRNSEALIINELYREINAARPQFDEFRAIAIPRNSYVLAGQKVEADILLAAYNKTVQPQVQINSGHLNGAPVSGVQSWETQASGAGLQTVKGTVTVDMNGNKIQKDFDFQYMVGTTGASIQLDKMNVFYIGVPNPITVSAAGYSVEDVSVNIPGGQVTPKEKGHYEVMMTTPGDIVATINAKDRNAGGAMKKVGEMKIRVKFIPDPVARVGNKSQGGLLTNIFKAQIGVIAALDNFDFDARFVVTSFQFSMLPKHQDLLGPYTVSGARFDGSRDVMQAISRCKPGDKVFIEEIKAKGPDGKVRGINSITLTLL
jgi:gliding motility-associated protein GldM